MVANERYLLTGCLHPAEHVTGVSYCQVEALSQPGECVWAYLLAPDISSLGLNSIWSECSINKFVSL